MITGELKSRVDRIWDTMWSGGISNPLSVIEQLTYLLFIKRLDELHTREEHKAARTRRPIEKPLFTARQDALRWSRFKELAPEQMFETVRDRVFPFIKSLRQTGDADEGSTYTDHMKDALFMMPTARVLANVVDQLDDIDMADRDTKGDLYEYMLGKIATAGQNGQFRTPRHIIRLMVDMTAPTPKDVICDPACGTAGFLVAASEHLVEHHGDRIYKNASASPPVQRGHLPRLRLRPHHAAHRQHEHAAARRGEPGHPLPGFPGPDRLGREAGDDAQRYSLVLANPPFAGSLDYESTAKDLQQVVKTKKTELLFVALFLRLLQTGGRAAVIVPDGVLFGSSKAHRTLRRIARRGAEARRRGLHALRRLQALRRGLDRHPALYQDQLRRHRQHLVLRHAGGRLLAGRQAHAATGEQRPCRHPRSLAEPGGRAQAGADGPELPCAEG